MRKSNCKHYAMNTTGNGSCAGSRKGSVLLATIIVIFFISTVVGSYVLTATRELREANRSFYYNATLNLAESAAEEALWALNQEDDTGWRKVGNWMSRQWSNYDLGNGVTGEKLVVVQDLDDMPTIVAEGRVELVNGQTLSKQIRIKLGRRNKFPNGLTAKDQLVFSGGVATVDAYDSSESMLNNRLDQGTVGSISAEVDALTLSNAEVFGFLATGGSTPILGPNGKVYGSDRAFEVETLGDRDFYVDPTRITMDFTATFDDVETPSGSGSELPEGNVITIGDPTGATTYVYEVDSIDIGPNKALIIQGPVILKVDGDIKVRGNNASDGIQLVGDYAKAEFYVGGDMDVGGNGIVNVPDSVDPEAPPQPHRLTIYGTHDTEGGQEFKLHGNAALAAAIYAPNANLDLSGGGSSGVFYGAAVAANITMRGNYSFRYDIRLNDHFQTDQSWRMEEWTEQTLAATRMDLDARM